MIRIGYSLGVAALLGIAAPLQAQEPAPPQAGLIDAVVAVVGDSVILRSDLDADVCVRIQAAGGDCRNPDPNVVAQLRPQVVSDKVEELLLLQAAQRDTMIVVADADLKAEVDREIAQRERQVGGAANLDAALRMQGMTREEFRDLMTQGMRRTALVQQYMAKVRQKRKPPTITDNDIRRYFEAHRAQFGERPATVTFRQVVVAPTPSDSAKAQAHRRAEAALEELRKGEDFVALAKRYTEEPGGRERGGDLGWFRQGQMVPEFEKTAFAMRPGQVSGIVETQYGYHIIKVEKVKGAEIQARHILFIPEKGDADVARAEDVARTVAEQVRGGAAMDSLVAKYGDKDEQARVGPYPIDRLPAEYTAALGSAQPGDVVGPFRVPSGDGSNKFAVVKVTDRQDKGEYSLDDAQVRAEIRARLEQEMLIEEVVGELRRGSYVDVRIGS